MSETARFIVFFLLILAAASMAIILLTAGQPFALDYRHAVTASGPALQDATSRLTVPGPPGQTPMVPPVTLDARPSPTTISPTSQRPMRDAPAAQEPSPSPTTIGPTGQQPMRDAPAAQEPSPAPTTTGPPGQQPEHGDSAAQDDQATPTHKPAIVSSPGQRPDLGENASVTGVVGESETGGDKEQELVEDYGSCYAAVAPLLGLAIFGAARGRRKHLG